MKFRGRAIAIRYVNGPYSADLYKQQTGKRVVQVGAYRLDSSHKKWIDHTIASI